jgi:hypothetical protein
LKKITTYTDADGFSLATRLFRCNHRQTCLPDSPFSDPAPIISMLIGNSGERWIANDGPGPVHGLFATAALVCAFHSDRGRRPQKRYIFSLIDKDHNAIQPVSLGLASNDKVLKINE